MIPKSQIPLTPSRYGIPLISLRLLQWLWNILSPACLCYIQRVRETLLVFCIANLTPSHLN